VSLSFDWRVKPLRYIVGAMTTPATPLLAVRWLVLAAGLLLATIAAPPASAGERLTVVELFTSQGCPLCPSADAFLGELAQRGDVLALSFHVGYWDYIGWADPFSQPAFTKRQEKYLDRFGLPYVFTPQVVVDGRMQASGNRQDNILRHIEVAEEVERGRIHVELTRISAVQVRIHIAAPEAVYRGEAEITLIRFDAKKETVVTTGENAGKTLVNYNVVRAMRPVADWNGEAVDLVQRLVELEGPGGDFCAVLIQERAQGRILGAAIVDMRGPGPG
jgi:hypothetical protein